MNNKLRVTKRSKYILRGLIILSGAFWIYTFAVSFVLLRNGTSDAIAAPQTQGDDLGNKYLALGFMCGVSSTILCRVVYRQSLPCIILHPKNSVWDPIKLLRRKTRIRYAYRSLTELESEKSRRTRALIPISDEFAVYLSDNSQKLRNNNYVFMACDEGREAHELSNKAQLAKHPLKQYLPRTYGRNEVQFPCILKYSEGYLSNGVFRVENEEELTDKIRNMNLNEDYIIQEAIMDSREYSTQFLVNDGEIVFQCGYCDSYASQLFVWPRAKRVSRSRFILDPEEELFLIFEQFFKGYTGFINCNYKFKDGQVKILEFNPRISGDIYAISKTDLKELIERYLELCS